MKVHALPLLAAGAMLLSGCAPAPPFNPDLCLDPAFTSDEVSEFQTAIDRWYDISAGNANLRLSCETRGVNVRLREATDPEVIAADQAWKSEVIALTTRETGEIWIVRSRAGDGFRQVAQHELGHWIGLRWPNCDYPRDCAHVPLSEAPALMTIDRSGASEFTPSDRLFCIASGVCSPSP